VQTRRAAAQAHIRWGMYLMKVPAMIARVAVWKLLLLLLHI
jgi:hypothetical protein